MDVRDVIALYGAATGTIALVLGAVGAYNNLKDRPWLRLRFRVLTRKRIPDTRQRQVMVEMANVGRRRALAYPARVEYLSPSWERTVNASPDEDWQEGGGWVPTDESGDPEPLVSVGEYETRNYLYDLPQGAKLIRVRATDSLGRRKSRYAFLGSTWLLLFRLRRVLRRGWKGAK
jgi:hypothetical protein